MLERIQVKGFKSIKEMDLTLRPLNVLIGANGSGKSNLLSLFTMLRWMSEGRLQNYVARSGGADTLLHYGRGKTQEIYLRLDFDKSGYEAYLAPTLDNRIYFSAEVALTYENGNQHVVHTGSGHSESNLEDMFRGNAEPRPLFVKGDILTVLESLRVYEFRDTGDDSSIKNTANIRHIEHLQADGTNLAAFMYRLQQNYLAEFDEIVKTVRLVAPFFNNFVLRPVPENPDTIRLRWLEQYSEDPFDVSQLSDGTLRFICLATLLLQPQPPSMIIIDEPELGLHPYAVSLLVDMLEIASKKTQVIVATQSVQLVNYLEPEDIIVVDRKEGASELHRVQPEEIESWLEDYSLGELWEKNVIGGRPQR